MDTWRQCVCLPRLRRHRSSTILGSCDGSKNEGKAIGQFTILRRSLHMTLYLDRDGFQRGSTEDRMEHSRKLWRLSQNGGLHLPEKEIRLRSWHSFSARAIPAKDRALEDVCRAKCPLCSIGALCMPPVLSICSTVRGHQPQERWRQRGERLSLQQRGQNTSRTKSWRWPAATICDDACSASTPQAPMQWRAVSFSACSL